MRTDEPVCVHTMCRGAALKRSSIQPVCASNTGECLNRDTVADSRESRSCASEPSHFMGVSPSAASGSWP